MKRNWSPTRKLKLPENPSFPNTRFVWVVLMVFLLDILLFPVRTSCYSCVSISIDDEERFTCPVLALLLAYCTLFAWMLPMWRRIVSRSFSLLCISFTMVKMSSCLWISIVPTTCEDVFEFSVPEMQLLKRLKHFWKRIISLMFINKIMLLFSLRTSS